MGLNKKKGEVRDDESVSEVELSQAETKLLSVQLQRMDESLRLWKNLIDSKIKALGGSYFRDGSTKIDLIIVVKKEKLRETEKRDVLQKFLTSLEIFGCQFEDEEGQIHKNILFIKVHCPENILENIALTNNFSILYKNPHFGERLNGVIQTKEVPPITNFSSFKQILQAVLIYANNRPNQLLTWERSYIVNKIMLKEFVPNHDGIDVEDILNSKIIEVVYPIHDGKWEWDAGGPINDRKLLAKVSTKFMKNTQQPINLYFKYYGPEVAFYFAFYKLYNKMLRIAAIVGVILTALSLPHTYLVDSILLDELCKSTKKMCPVTCDMKHNCEYFELSKKCLEAKLTILSDNLFTILFGIFMSIWATVFLAIWRRKQSLLMVKWNRYLEIRSLNYRKKYLTRTHLDRIWHYTGEKEPYTPMKIMVGRYAIVGCVFFLMMLLFLFSLVMNMYLRMEIQRAWHEYLPHNVGFLMIVVTGFIAAVIMIAFDWLSNQVAHWLTIFENPRTKQEFDKSYITKAYILVFFNHNLPLLYNAFVQGHLFSHPGHTSKYEFVRRFEAQACFASGCVMKLCIHLMMQIIVKSFFKMIVSILIMHFKEKHREKKFKNYQISQFEDDYTLHKMINHHWIMSYMSIAVQFGYVTFFVSVLPLAPALAYIFNTVDIKFQALKRIKHCRRPIARRVTGIETWNDVFRAIAILGTILNACTIAFTTDFIPRTYYRIAKSAALKGYIDSTLTEFSTSDYPSVSPEMETSVKTCFFKGLRNNYNEPNKYEFKLEYWKDLALRVMFVFIFEHAILAFVGALFDAIPKEPYSVKKELDYESKHQSALNAEKTENVSKTNRPYKLPTFDDDGSSFEDENDKREETV